MAKVCEGLVVVEDQENRKFGSVGKSIMGWKISFSQISSAESQTCFLDLEVPSTEIFSVLHNNKSLELLEKINILLLFFFLEEKVKAVLKNLKEENVIVDFGISIKNKKFSFHPLFNLSTRFRKGHQESAYKGGPVFYLSVEVTLSGPSNLTFGFDICEGVICNKRAIVEIDLSLESIDLEIIGFIHMYEALYSIFPVLQRTYLPSMDKGLFKLQFLSQLRDLNYKNIKDAIGFRKFYQENKLPNICWDNVKVYSKFRSCTTGEETTISQLLVFFYNEDPISFLDLVYKERNPYDKTSHFFKGRRNFNLVSVQNMDGIDQERFFSHIHLSSQRLKEDYFPLSIMKNTSSLAHYIHSIQKKEDLPDGTRIEDGVAVVERQKNINIDRFSNKKLLEILLSIEGCRLKYIEKTFFRDEKKEEVTHTYHFTTPHYNTRASRLFIFGLVPPGSNSGSNFKNAPPSLYLSEDRFTSNSKSSKVRRFLENINKSIGTQKNQIDSLRDELKLFVEKALSEESPGNDARTEPFQNISVFSLGKDMFTILGISDCPISKNEYLNNDQIASSWELLKSCMDDEEFFKLLLFTVTERYLWLLMDAFSSPLCTSIIKLYYLELVFNSQRTFYIRVEKLQDLKQEINSSLVFWTSNNFIQSRRLEIIFEKKTFKMTIKCDEEEDSRKENSRKERIRILEDLINEKFKNGQFFEPKEQAWIDVEDSELISIMIGYVLKGDPFSWVAKD